jgi:hypothetical protein
MERRRLGFGGEVFEGVHAPGAVVAIHGPEIGVRRFAGLDDFLAGTLAPNDGARVDFEGIEVLDAQHPPRREGPGRVEGGDVVAHGGPLLSARSGDRSFCFRTTA